MVPRKFRSSFSLLALLFVFVEFELPYCGPHYVSTGSVPMGWYFLVPDRPHVGNYVKVCLPEGRGLEIALSHHVLHNGYECPGWLQAEIKVLAATSGQRVTIDFDGISIDGKRWPDSIVYHAEVPHLALGSFIVEPHKVFVLGFNVNSYDSRYYGALPDSSIRGTAFPFGSHTICKGAAPCDSSSRLSL